ncbi:MAG: twitching motility protein PilT [Verrucomicrobiae bacterium]|nr:twitching motility protein PilT [Verrucomicrobiae bacterium]
MNSVYILRFFFLILLAVAGWVLPLGLNEPDKPIVLLPWQGTFWGLVIGLGVIFVDRVLKGFSLRAFSVATFGLLLGCVMAWLIRSSGIFYYVPEKTLWVINLGVYLSFSYIGMVLALRSNRDDFSLIIPYVRFVREQAPEPNVILDTSSIIDGRIADVIRTGFIQGTIYIPHFVLHELQMVADSADPARRARGRRGLDLVRQIQEEGKVDIKISDHDYPDEKEVDGKLVRAAKVLGAKIITTDYNLNKVAEIQKIHTLNINDLANALKTSMIPGDVINGLKLVREGREHGQALGYLADGTMIVVNNSHRHIGHEVDAKVISVLQTSAGRMVFADLDRDVNGTHTH